MPTALPMMRASQSGKNWDSTTMWCAENPTAAMAWAIGIVRIVLVPSLVGPVGYGIWKLLLVVDSFARVANLGTVSALPRRETRVDEFGQDDVGPVHADGVGLHPVDDLHVEHARDLRAVEAAAHGLAGHG